MKAEGEINPFFPWTHKEAEKRMQFLADITRGNTFGIFCFTFEIDFFYSTKVIFGAFWPIFPSLRRAVFGTL